MVQVELVYIPEQSNAVHLLLEVDEGATVQTVIEIANVWNTHPETKDYLIGIFAKRVSLDTLVKAGDRIEIYRPLVVDPMEKRKQRAKR